MAKGWIASMIIIVCGIIGILFAIMLQMMYADGLVINALVDPTITLEAIQAVVIIVWLLVGVIFASMIAKS